jgi:hypothetical protein
MRPGPPPLTAAGCSLVRPNGATRACDLLFVLVMIQIHLFTATRRFLPQPPCEGRRNFGCPRCAPTPGAAFSYRTPKVRISFERR